MRAINNITRGVCQVGINAWKVASMPKALRDKFLFLWTGGYSGNDLKDSLGSSAVISVTGKDWTTRYIPQNTSATFSVPDNATFLSADGDNFWFDTLDVRQQKTHADLIASTTMRTFIKYADFEPYNIYAIGILKAGEIITDADKITLNKFFKLWAEYWGELMDSGYMKDNRGGDSLHPELETYLTGLATPLSTTQVSKLNQFITSLKTGFGITSLSEVFDVIYLLGGETEESSLKNLVADSFHLTLVNAPTWIQFEGYNGANGKYIDTNFNLATQAVRFTLNSGSYGFYSRTNIDADISEGGIVYGGNRTFCQIRRKLNNASIIDFNQGSTGNTKINAITDSRGLFVISRRASNLTDIYRNRDFKVSDNVISSAIPNNTFYILGINQNGVIGLSSSRQISLFFISRLLSPNEIAIVSDTVETYMVSNNKGL